MPQLRDFRSDFRKGRTGKALRVRADTGAYVASLREAENMMVRADGSIARRWGTLLRTMLDGKARLVPFVYASASTAKFLLIFTDQQVQIRRLSDLSVVQTFVDTPWTDASLQYIQFAGERDMLVVTDTSFQPRTLRFNAGTGLFSIAYFDFDLNLDKTRLQAPFFTFNTDLTLLPRIFTTAGASNAYGPHIAQAFAVPASQFDLSEGTGRIVATSAGFAAGHAGTRMRVLDGEFEITNVVSSTVVDVKVTRNLARQLDANPFFLRESSRIVECAWPEHGFERGNRVFFMGLKTDSAASNLMIHAPQIALNDTQAPIASTAAGYVVSRVIDEAHFEFTCADGVVPPITELSGGGDVMGLPMSGVTGVQEPVFSDLRGWPQCCVIHESRLWFGGSTALPDAVIGSQIYDFFNFDTGDGDPGNAILMLGIGARVQVRHLVSDFDLLIFSDGGCHYVPGSREQAITQETARAITASRDGASYTAPLSMDGATFYIDEGGLHVRELAREAEAAQMTSTPLSIVCDDWIRGPVESARYAGSRGAAQPLGFFVNSEDGSLLVLHSARANDAFGFMRWTMEDARFESIAAVEERLFAVVERAGERMLVEFDTGAGSSTDLQHLAAGSATISSTIHANRRVQVTQGARLIADETLDFTGDLDLLEAPGGFVMVGVPMQYSLELHPAVAADTSGPRMGSVNRLVHAEVYWDATTTGTVYGYDVVPPVDASADMFAAPVPFDGWERYPIGEWGKEVAFRMEGDQPGALAIRAITLNVYF